MAKLTNRYVTDEFFQSIFRDKDTGLPLSAGKLWFYKDQARTKLKTIYTVSGAPADYDVIALPNPLTLSSYGTIQDGSNNDVILYLFPYNNADDEELYYIVCKNSGDIEQFTREGIPNTAVGAIVGGEALNNYISNGQFLIHRTIPQEELDNHSNIQTYGGFLFVTDASSFTDHEITYERFGSVITNPTANPRYACRFKCIIPEGGTTFKYIGVGFQNVNRFASDENTYTFSFSAKSNSGSSLETDIIVRKIFGSGGSAEEIIKVKENFQITTEFTTFSFPIVFETNEGKTIGANNDDFVDIFFSLLPDQGLDISITNLILTDGDVDLQVYPEETTAEDQYRSLFTKSHPAVIADLDDVSNNLLLPVILTRSGLSYDHSRVGKVEAAMYESTQVNGIWYGQDGELECNGATLQADEFSKEGVSWTRLQTALWRSGVNLPRFGTGGDFVTTLQESPSSSHFILNTNHEGVTTDAADGAIATGFSFHSIHPGNTHPFHAWVGSDNVVYIKNNNGGFCLASVPGDSGFGINQFRKGVDNIRDIPHGRKERTGVAVNSIAGLAGKWFGISDIDTAPPLHDYYVWFTVDGAGADPTPPGRRSILIHLRSTYTVQEARQIIADTVAGYYSIGIFPIAAASITAGSYFIFNNRLPQQWYVWYEKDGAGTDPAVGGAIKGIKVVLEGSDDAPTVGLKTLLAINRTSLALPRLNQVFLRGWKHESTMGHDPDSDRRRMLTDQGGGATGNRVGSFQEDEVKPHSHRFYDGAGGSDPDWSSPVHASANLANPRVWGIEMNQGLESRPVSVYTMFVIRY